MFWVVCVAALAPGWTAGEPPAAPLPPPVEPVVGSKDADDAFVAGKYAEAYTLYQQRALRNAFDLDAHDGISSSAAKMGRVKDAVAWYEKMPSGHPGWCYGAARAMLTDGDEKQASALLYRALDLNKGLGRAYFLLGLMYTTQARPDFPTAMNAFDRATRLDPKYGPSYYQLARLEAGFRGRIGEAKGLLAKALLYLTPVQNELRVQAHVLLGGLLSGERNYDEALMQLEAARTLAGDAIYEQVNIGRVYELKGDREGALREWNAVRTRFGLATPIGLDAFRCIRRIVSKASVDFSDFIPRGTPAQYLLLVTNLVRPRPPETVAVPAIIAKLLDDLKVPVRLFETDLDGDGKVELVVVEARSLWDADSKGYYAGKPVLHVYTPKGGQLGYFDSQMDVFWDARVVDFNGDNKKEIVFAGFTPPNVLNLSIMTHQGRRLLSTYAQTVTCVASPSGALVDDLDGDGKLELMTVDGSDLWVTVRRWNDAGTFTDASAEFPAFFEAYVKKYERLKPAELDAFPIVRQHLRDAHALLLMSVKTRPRAEEEQP